MSIGELLIAIIVFAIAGLLLFIAIRHFNERGYLFNNAYIFASKEQREIMNKRPYYRQSAIVFSILCIVFVVIGLSIVLQNSMIMLLEIPLFIGVIIYAIISTIKCNNHVKDGE